MNEKNSKDDGDLHENLMEFRSLVGSLLYPTKTRPNLMFLVGLLSGYMSSPIDVHIRNGKGS